MLLRLDGYDVARAVDLESALRIGRSFHPDAVLMDIAMPGVDGYEVARQMRVLPEIAASTVFIVVSGFCQADDFRRSEAAGFAHHLVKPVDPAESRPHPAQHDRALRPMSAPRGGRGVGRR